LNQTRFLEFGFKILKSSLWNALVVGGGLGWLLMPRPTSGCLGDISWPLKIPEPIKTSPWFGVLTDRAKEVSCRNDVLSLTLN
jgi:hypothetical protein